MNAYRKQILSHICSFLGYLAADPTILDFACGDGWSASQVGNLASAKLTVPDVKCREEALLKPILYFLGGALHLANELVAGFWPLFPQFSPSGKSC